MDLMALIREGFETSSGKFNSYNAKRFLTSIPGLKDKDRKRALEIHHILADGIARGELKGYRILADGFVDMVTQDWELLEGVSWGNVELGGPGSGHHGHKGIPGSQGGSVGGSGFGVWSASHSQETVTKMQEKYPKFYKRAEEHVLSHAEEYGEIVGKGFLTEDEIPDEIVRLTQWDLSNRLDGDDRVKLYAGLFDHKRRLDQPSVSDWEGRLEGRTSIMSFTSNPEKAYDFSEGVGAVLTDRVPIKNILASPFTVPELKTLLPGEFEFIGKLDSPRIRTPGQFKIIIESYRKSGYGPETLIGYSGYRPSNVWQE